MDSIHCIALCTFFSFFENLLLFATKPEMRVKWYVQENSKNCERTKTDVFYDFNKLFVKNRN